MLVASIDSLMHNNIDCEVILPYREVLDEVLLKKGIKVSIGPVAVIRRQYCNLRGIFRLMIYILQGMLYIWKQDYLNKFDCIYTNTAPVISGALYAFFFRKKHIWHIHEIIDKPYFYKIIITKLINLCSTICIANSNATRDFLVSSGVKAEKIATVFNGVEVYTVSSSYEVLSNSSFVIGMLGRFNRIKGQDIFVEAASIVLKQRKNIDFFMVRKQF